MQHSVRKLVLVQRRRIHYRQAYQESGYRRPFIQRLTPLAWLVIALALLALIATAAAVVTRLQFASVQSEPLPQRLAITSVAAPTLLPTPLPARAPATPLPHPAASQSTPVPTITPTATPDPSYAPWAGRLILQPDGTRLAPQDVISQALEQLSAYYEAQRDLSLDRYLRERDAVLQAYFTGAALAQMRVAEMNRQQYAMNRSGRYSIILRDFSRDGMTAKAGIILRNWVSDVYDVSSQKLLETGRREPDSLTVMTIQLDRANGRWKFAAVLESGGLQP